MFEPRLEAGRMLGSYRIEELAGRGAMGVVYRAYHEALDRTVAVKVLQVVGQDQDAVVRFRREAQAIAQLRHPNVLDVFDFGEVDGVPYMVVEYIAGGSLADRIRTAPLHPVEAVGVLQGVGSALDYAHGRGILHRDVKPENVLMAADSNPVLADFGLVKLIGSSVQTMAGMRGTPTYMPPEQVTGRGVTAAADRYSFAAMAYELLAGRPPFEATDLMQLVYAHAHLEPPPTGNSSLGAHVEETLRKGLAKVPEARWESCQALVDALHTGLRLSVNLRNPAAALSATAVDAFIQADLEGRIESFDAEAERIFGWSRDEVVGRLLHETIVPPSFRPAHTAGLGRYRETGVSRVAGKPLSVFGLHKDGREIPIRITVDHMLAPDGRQVATAVIRERHDSSRPPAPPAPPSQERLTRIGGTPPPLPPPAAVPPAAAPPAARGGTPSREGAGYQTAPPAPGSAVDVLIKMGVPKLRTDERFSLNSHFANAIHTAREVAGDRWPAVAYEAELTEYEVDDPPSNEERGTPIENLSLLNEGFEIVFGHDAPEVLRRWGRLATERSLAARKSAGAEQRALRLVPGEQRKLGILLRSYAQSMDRVRGAHVHAWTQVSDHQFWLVQFSNLYALGRRKQEKSCHVWTASFEAMLRWAGLANSWLVEEVECGCVTGTFDCVFAIRHLRSDAHAG